ncbi:MAG: NAD-dependent malic enzyme [Afipia sp.]|nr:NAD-dependent malic enzyme [Afipia sp.]
MSLLRNPLRNKGTAFTAKEREDFGLVGLLPPRVLTMQAQATRFMENLRASASELEKFVALNALRDRNEALFYRVVCDHIDEIQPLIYTPTVGMACEKYGLIFQRPRGIFISYNDRGRIAEILRNWPHKPKLIVVTDGERILGLGDLGINGMGISVGKLSLYSACAGVHPELCLPIALDVGTNNDKLLNDPYYLGAQEPRRTGDEYDHFIDEFISAAKETFPGVLIQFEDFANRSAFHLLEKYRGNSCVFNDDIQGTAAVAVAGLFSALRVTGQHLKDQNILFLGAGEAARGIADLVVAAMMEEGAPESEAIRRNWLVDSRGLIVSNRSDLNEHKKKYAHDHPQVGSFIDAVRILKPTVLIGVCAKGGAFNSDVLRAVAEINERPIIFALSNPTSHAECKAEEAYRYTGGRALFACGSPFASVRIGQREFVPRQGNNSYIFPGVGLGVIAAQARIVTDEMFLVAAHTLANCVSDADINQGSLYPALSRIREVSARIAASVAKVAFDRQFTDLPQPNDLATFIQEQMYEPHY